MRVKNIALATITLALSIGNVFASTTGVLSSTGGRFVYGQINDLGKSTRLLDTQTGRLWEVLCVVDTVDESDTPNKRDCEYHLMKPVFFMHDDGKVSLTPDGPRFAAPK